MPHRQCRLWLRVGRLAPLAASSSEYPPTQVNLSDRLPGRRRDDLRESMTPTPDSPRWHPPTIPAIRPAWWIPARHVVNGHPMSAHSSGRERPSARWESGCRRFAAVSGRFPRTRRECTRRSRLAERRHGSLLLMITCINDAAHALIHEVHRAQVLAAPENQPRSDIRAASRGVGGGGLRQWLAVPFRGSRETHSCDVESGRPGRSAYCPPTPTPEADVGSKRSAVQPVSGRLVAVRSGGGAREKIWLE
jgi:hypothetical protein